MSSPRSMYLLTALAATAVLACNDPPDADAEFCASDFDYRLLFEVTPSAVDADLIAVARSAYTTAALTADGGLTLTHPEGVLRRVDTPPTGQLRHLAIAPDPCKPWDSCKTAAVLVVGDGGAALRSVDGGQTYAPLDLGTVADLRHVEFFHAYTEAEPEAIVGLIAGDGVLLRSDDLGATWKWVALTADTTGSFRAVAATHDRAYAVGDAGHLIESRDFGATWFRRAHDLTDDLQRVHVDAGGTLVIVTADGSVVMEGELGALVRLTPKAPIVDLIPHLDDGLIAAYADGRLGPWPETSDAAAMIELPAPPLALSNANGLSTAVGVDGSLTTFWLDDRELACEPQID